MEIQPPDDIELELVDSSDGVDPLRTSSRRTSGAAIDVSFRGELYLWRGPAPYHFIRVPPEEARAIHAVASAVTYGWGMVPATVEIGGSTWDTALWPKDGGYVIPIKDRYRKAETIELGETVEVRVAVHR